MTNDAPERIWAVYGWSEVLSFNVYYNGGTEYIRADHAQAEKEAAVKAAVAAAYEDAAEIAEWKCNKRLQYALGQAVRDSIRARTDTDALEAVKAEARAEARQVKPLKWWRSDTGDLCCDTLVGRYQIQTGRERYFIMPAISPGRRNRPDGDAVPSWHKSEESAKAAAQDDYERRVLSALIPADQNPIN